MKNFKVTYNKTPTAHNVEKCLIIRAETQVEAVITAFDHLTNKGHCVGKGLGYKPSVEDQKTLNTRGVKFELGAGAGMTVLTGVEEYNVKPQGKVIG